MMGLDDPLVQKPPPMLRGFAHDLFLKQLYAGVLRPSELVIQSEICDLLVVPVGPMREALTKPEGQGVVTLPPCTVTGFSISTNGRSAPPLRCA